MQLADRVTQMSESATLKMAAMATSLKEEGKDVISLALGEPDFNIPKIIKQAAHQAIDDNYSSYTPVPGLKGLREAICQKLKRDNGLDFEVNQIVVSTGAKQTLMNIFLAILNPGDEVILPAPFWVSYEAMGEFCQAKIRVISTDISTDFKVTPAVLEESLSSQTKLYVFSNPCNPSGSMYNKAELEALTAVFAKYDCMIVSDEIYEYINYGDPLVSLGSFSNIRDRVITVNGVSKGFAMTGWRIGFMAGPVEVAKACSKLQGQFTSGANAIAQKASELAFLKGKSEALKMKDTFLKRRDLMISLLSEIPGLKVNKPMGAFYLFPDVSAFFGKTASDGKKIESSEDLSMYLLSEALVATTAGEAFGCPKNIRMSYANSDEQLKEAAHRLKKALSKLS